MKHLATPLLAFGALAAVGDASAAPPLYGTVISATPVTVQAQVPQQRCTDEPGYVQRPTTGGGAVVGGVLGGLAGNAIGAGAGRALATGVGVIAGALAGNGIEAANTPPVPVTTQNCVYSRATEYRVVGYDVVYEFNGERYTTRTARDPGSRIALDVRPTGETPFASPSTSPYDAPQPVAVAPAPVVSSPSGPVYPAYPSYDGPPAYPYPPFGYGYGYPYPSVYLEGGFGGGWHGHRGR